MASVFKTFNANDIATTTTKLAESLPLSGSLASGSYSPAHPSEGNIKNYSHGMFQSVYDYPHLSSSANHIYDITVGFSSDSALSRSTPGTQQAKKINTYNQMAQVLMGHDITGSIQKFDQDGNILAGGTKLRECYFICFSRLLYKDEIKKGSFTMKLGSNESYESGNNSTLTITDAGAASSFFTNSPVGEYAILSASNGEATGTPSGNVGLIYYQAGVAVITASVFLGAPSGSMGQDANMFSASSAPSRENIIGILTGSEISGAADALRHRLIDITFNNTVELNSSIYFCRLNHNEFNYSSNPTYLSSSKIVVKTNSTDEPVTYVSTIGLYSEDNALLATAKVSEVLKKTPSNEVLIRVRLDN